MKIEIILRDCFIPKLQRAVASLTKTDIKITEIKALPKTEIVPGAQNSLITIASPEGESFFFLGIAYAIDQD